MHIIENMLFFAYGIDTPKRLSKQLLMGSPLGQGKPATLYNHKIAHFAYNPVLAMGYETLTRQDGSQVQGQVYTLTHQQIEMLDAVRPRHTRAIKLVHIQGEHTRRKCMVYEERKLR